ncbi:hypothetical protein LCGC14_0659340 [marine sediment metagenome]|uniref:Uncharacterized protein n=1 Tax=marine sediment metagenome TaxID=412755 RepID=A0A0F9U2G7_9ZZZZ
MKIQFVGDKKTGQERYRGSTSLIPNLVCRLDQPQTCTLEAGVHLSDNEALRLLTQYNNLFISHDTHLANLAVAAKIEAEVAAAAKKKAATAKRVATAAAKKKAKAAEAAAEKPKTASKPKPTKKPASKAKSGGK